MTKNLTRASRSNTGTGTNHVCTILDNGDLLCWGRSGGFHPRGLQNTENIGEGRTAIDVSCGAAHTCVLLDDKTVKCWGANDDRQTGYYDRNRRVDVRNIRACKSYRVGIRARDILREYHLVLNYSYPFF